MEKYLDRALRDYAQTDAYPFHMPGHKRRLGSLPDPYSIDITEIDGFDNLHHAEGIIRDAQARAAALYGAEETHFLVNGSTCGILTAVSSAVTAGRKKGRGGILMARNNHKAALHAAYMCDVTPVWIVPRPLQQEKATSLQLGGRIDSLDVDMALTMHPEVGTVLIVSPTYDGVISDVGRIADVVHRHDAVLIVDEAHGAHYGLHADLPASSVQLGADLVIHSLHKTLPSLTQTALLHIGGQWIDRALVRRFLGIYQTSSPSYVLMASMDQCIRIVKEQGESLFPHFLSMLDRFYQSVSDLRMLRIIRTDDPSKILIAGGESQLSGRQICAILRQSHGLEPEMEAPGYALALCSIGDDEEGLVRLSKALRQIDEEQFIAQRFGKREQELPGQTDTTDIREAADLYTIALPEQVLSIREAWDSDAMPVPLEQAAGCTAAEPVYLYPPGIPVCMPGEQITQAQIRALLMCRDAGFSLQGMVDMTMQSILVTNAKVI